MTQKTRQTAIAAALMISFAGGVANAQSQQPSLWMQSSGSSTGSSNQIGLGAALQGTAKNATGANTPQAQASSAANNLFQPPPATIPGVTGQDKCRDIERIVNQSASDALLARMPDSTPNQAMSDAGVFETMSKDVNFLGNLLGGLFDFINTGNFFTGMDHKINIVADNAFNSIGSQLTRQLFNTTVRTATNTVTRNINREVNETIREINRSVPSTIAQPVTDAISDTRFAVNDTIRETSREIRREVGQAIEQQMSTQQTTGQQVPGQQAPGGPPPTTPPTAPPQQVNPRW